MATAEKCHRDMDIDTNRGLLYRVSFDDGSTRLMRELSLYHAWFDIETQQIVGVVWLPIPGKSGKYRVCFADLSSEIDTLATRAFGGAIVSNLELVLGLGDPLSWSIWDGDQWRVKSGVVEEIVAKGGLPDRTRFPKLFRSSGIRPSRNHRSFVVRVPGATAKASGKVYWPRVSSFTKN